MSFIEDVKRLHQLPIPPFQLLTVSICTRSSLAPFKVVIIGGSLSEALLANGLLNNGVDTIIYEREEEKSERTSYQNRLRQAAVKGLGSCLTESHLSTILPKL